MAANAVATTAVAEQETGNIIRLPHCPNCGKDWNGSDPNPRYAIRFQPLEGPEESLELCPDCMRGKPQYKMNINRIITALTGAGWPKQKRLIVRLALERHIKHSPPL